ncbi:hypothetical protein FJZ39_00710 [Candidatus Saccharibacteria bacterium]|nr:hypothetical protein [Candidatus Saccharibacteria bacterium]
MSVISPAILAENEVDYNNQVEKIASFCERLHIDVSDGEFAPRLTVSLNQVWWPETVKADIHMMVQRPAEHLEWLLKLRPHLVLFHAEAEGDIVSVIKQLQSSGIKAGVVLQRKTVPATVAPLIEASDHVMIFSGELGQFGGTASLMQLEKVRLIHRIKAGVEIGWDGGVSTANIYSLVHGGVQVLAVGGALQKSHDAQVAYNELLKEATKQGIL